MMDFNKQIHGDTPMEERLPPSTFDFLEYRACIDPEKIALATKSRRVTYSSFYQDAVRFTIALKDLGVCKGSLVLVIDTSDIYLHWLLLIACENNGAISASCLNVERLQSINFLDEVDFLFAEDVHKIERAKRRTIQIDAAWQNKVFGMTGCNNRYVPQNSISSADAQRITHSSGTTGGEKAMTLNRGAQEMKMRFLSENLHLGNEDSLLLTMPFSVNATYLCATHFLRLGLLIVSGPLLWALQNFPITYFEILPMALADLLKKIPSGFVRPKKLGIKVVGASFNLDLEEKSLLTVCTDISGRYAANEVWPIAYEVRHDSIGTLIPGVHVKILDDSGVAMTDGSVGQIAVKSSTMIRGYYKNDEATKRHFVDGYFLTGDLGRLLPSRKLQIVGRCDDVLNLGGLKIPPDAIESRLQNIAGVIDLAVTSVASGQVIDDLCIAIVRANDSDRKAIVREIKSRIFSLGLHRFRMKFMDILPKTENGKLSRRLLRQMFVN
jgi:acyl-coenzyme A synthetase/AMP-(fatty) acid ligase